jgi:RNA polymerase sigma factor (sigma-70 family)
MSDRYEGDHGRPSGKGLDELTRHVQLAQAGDAASLTWLVLHLSPLLRAQARYRIRGTTQRDCDPDDLVDETWTVALPRLGSLSAEPQHLGRALLGFLTTTLLNKAKALRERNRRQPRGRGTRDAPGSAILERLSAQQVSASTTVRDLEEQEALHDAIDSLSEKERGVVVLRGLEQRSNEETAALLGLTPAGASRRFQRALERLRLRMPASIFGGLRGDQRDGPR